MDITDLSLVVVYCTCLYALVVAVTRKEQFLTRGVNPNRGAVFLAGVSALATGTGLLRWEAHSSDLAEWGKLLRKLVTQEPTPPRAQAAAVAMLFGLLLISLVTWCWWNLPRDPSTFTGPGRRHKAMRYYVVKLKAGLDYALLAEGDGMTVAEAVDPKDIARTGVFLPKLRDTKGEAHVRTVEEQIAGWRSAAHQIHQRMTEWNAVVLPAGQGPNRRMIFDVEYGGMFFIYLRVPEPSSGCPGLYLFAATLSQHEMNNKRAEEHFDLLVEALRHTEHAIKLG